MEGGRLLACKIISLLHPLPIPNLVFPAVPGGQAKPGIYQGNVKQREMLLHTSLAGYRGFRKWEHAGPTLCIHALQTHA